MEHTHTIITAQVIDTPFPGLLEAPRKQPLKWLAAPVAGLCMFAGRAHLCA